VSTVGYNDRDAGLVQFYKRGAQEGFHYPYGTFRNQSDGSRITAFQGKRPLSQVMASARSFWVVSWHGLASQDVDLARLNRVTMEVLQAQRQQDTPYGRILSIGLARTLDPWTGKDPQTQMEYAQRGSEWLVMAAHR
jgi:hypothetical protein